MKIKNIKNFIWRLIKFPIPKIAASLKYYNPIINNKLIIEI
jgi:hypothetical protein